MDNMPEKICATCPAPDYGMLIVFPDYPINIRVETALLGHAGVLIISGRDRESYSKGDVFYYDFGRYASKRLFVKYGAKTKLPNYLGSVRNEFNTLIQDKKVEFDRNNWPQNDSLKSILRIISERAGKRTRIYASLNRSPKRDGFTNMYNYAQYRLKIHDDVQESFLLKAKALTEKTYQEMLNEYKLDMTKYTQELFETGNSFGLPPTTPTEKKAAEKTEHILLKDLSKKYPNEAKKLKYELWPKEQNTCLDFAIDVLKKASINVTKSGGGIPSITAWDRKRIDHISTSRWIEYEYVSNTLVAEGD